MAGTEIGVTVRPARAADLPQWVSLRQALWPLESADELAAEARKFLAGNGFMLEAVLLAAERNGTILGFAELSRRPYAEGCETTPVAFLEGWYVAPDARGRGIGGKLIQAAEQWAREQGYSEFASDTTLDNTGSAAAHQALGFEEVEIIRCFRKSL
jgi:aminoglycoside 6'-N-acetyltransferase I